MENDELLHKWVNGNLTSEELAVLKQRPEYDSLVELYQNTSNLTAPSFDGDTMLANILKEEKQAPAIAKTRSLSSLIMYAAAAVALLLATWFLWPNGNTSVMYQLAKGEKMEGQLPDQSGFVLNAESSLTYDRESWETARTLQLTGEAFFEVQKGSTFKVVTPNGIVQVLGTSFNVWSRNQVLEVSCQSGKVAVLSEAGNILAELVKQEAIRVSQSRASEKWQIQAAEKASWVDGISRFRKVPLGTVLKALERQFDIQIDAGKIDIQEIINCNFKQDDLDLALQTSLSQLGINYKIVDDKLVILSE